MSGFREKRALSFGHILLFLLLGCGPAYGDNGLPPRIFAHPDRIRYDRQCLTIDGKNVFIYSGSFHFFRCPKALWADRFRTIRAAGFNTVTTYVPWNWCERQMPAGTGDFSKIDLQDFNDWLDMAEKFGFYIIVRPGPYICAEWDTGGFPQWLLTKKPEHPLRSQGWLRSDDPVFLAWSKHWYDAVCPVIARHQITRKSPGQPGVILVQVENEYDFGPPFSDEAKENELRALVKFARTDGIDVPLISCWTRQIRGQTDPWLRQVFDCCNFYPRWNVDSILPEIKKLRREQPDAPLATTELQGGWFSSVGGKLSQDQDGLASSQINNLTLFAIQNGETILNYYMLFGGTNPDDWGGRNVTTSYDYDAPVREWGGVGARYQAVRAIGLMLRKYGVDLARSRLVHCKFTASQDDVKIVERGALNGGRYLFVRTSQHLEPRRGTATVTEQDGGSTAISFRYDLQPFGSKILYLPPGVNNASQGIWLPKKAPPITRPNPSDVPKGVTITTAITRPDLGPVRWTKLKPGETLAQAGIYDSHFIFYKTELLCSAPTNLLVEFPDGDSVVATVNGKPELGLAHRNGSSIFQLVAGTNTIKLLYENHGFANGGPQLEQPGGITRMSLTGNTISDEIPITGWRMKLVSDATNPPEIEPAFDDANWTNVATEAQDANQLAPGQDAVFRANIDLTAGDLMGTHLHLTFGRIDDRGWVYINGNFIGKANDWSRPYSFDATRQSHPGHNEIAVVVQNVDGGGGIAMPSMSVSGAALPLTLFGRPMGDRQQWWKPGLDESHWTSAPVGKQSASVPTASSLSWFRMHFSIPQANPAIWAPWRLHLVAGGNGFLYLNGHPLGRYWEAGPQHDFFLPECWLRSGDHSTNFLALDLRSTASGAWIESAAVTPYPGFSEEREQR